MQIKGWSAALLHGRGLPMEERATTLAVTPRRHRWVPGCSPSGALGLCRAARVPWPWGHLSCITVMEPPAGSSHAIPAISPPAWPCLYLTMQQEVLMRTSFRNRVIFLRGNPMVAQMIKRRRASLHGQDPLCAAFLGKIHLGSIQCCMNTGCRASEGM